jgi:hypothetical protein
MPDYRKRALDAVKAVLSDGTTGFNAQLGAISMAYGITAFDLEFDIPSENVVYGFLDDEEVAVSQIIKFPGAVVYTSEAVDERRIINRAFSGFVAAHINIYIRLRALDDPNISYNQPDFDGDFEKWPNAISHAICAAWREGRSLMASSNILQDGYREDRDPVQSLGDGHVQVVRFTFGLAAR